MFIKKWIICFLHNLYEWPCECNIYIDIEKAKIKLNILDANEICWWKNIFEKSVKGSIYCASFCKDGNNEYLWKSYAGDYEGFAIEYNINDLVNALKNAGIDFAMIIFNMLIVLQIHL